MTPGSSGGKTAPRCLPPLARGGLRWGGIGAAGLAGLHVGLAPDALGLVARLHEAGAEREGAEQVAQAVEDGLGGELAGAAAGELVRPVADQLLQPAHALAEAGEQARA